MRYGDGDRGGQHARCQTPAANAKRQHCPSRVIRVSTLRNRPHHAPEAPVLSRLHAPQSTRPPSAQQPPVPCPIDRFQPRRVQIQNYLPRASQRRPLAPLPTIISASSRVTSLPCLDALLQPNTTPRCSTNATTMDADLAADTGQQHLSHHHDSSPPRVRAHTQLSLRSSSASASTGLNGYDVHIPAQPEQLASSTDLILADGLDLEPMASATLPRQRLRSPGRDLVGSSQSRQRSASRETNRTFLRSSSAVGAGQTDHQIRPLPGKTSVKDLRRRFDQTQNEASSATVPIHPATHAGPDQSSFASRIHQAQDTASNLDASNANFSTSRPSFARQPSSRTDTHGQSQGLLFGEILPEQRNLLAAGYGIDDVLDNEAHGKGLQVITSHQRSLSDPDAESNSPSGWYRENESHAHVADATRSPSRIPRARSKSDVASSRSDPNGAIKRRPATRVSSTSTNAASPPSSKLPRSTRGIGSSAGSSPSGTRSNSPAGYRRPRPHARKSNIADTPASTTRAAKPSQAGTSGRFTADDQARDPAAATGSGSNARLQAYIASPPPKLSPPLRSSRPRQPVSVATTASSRLKEVGRKVPTTGKAAANNSPEKPTRRRKISIGPIDFEQRREHIRLAYSRSIRESQAFEARERAVERRRKELEVAAKAKAAAAAATQAQIDSLPGSDSETALVDRTRGRPVRAHSRKPASERMPQSAESGGQDQSSPAQSPVEPGVFDVPLKLSLGGQPSPQHTKAAPADPPRTPGIHIPGAFPANTPESTKARRPISTMSGNSDSTEFETEEQIADRDAEQSPCEIPITIVKPPSPDSTAAASKSGVLHLIADHSLNLDDRYNNVSPINGTGVIPLELQLDTPVEDTGHSQGMLNLHDAHGAHGLQTGQGDAGLERHRDITDLGANREYDTDLEQESPVEGSHFRHHFPRSTSQSSIPSSSDSFIDNDETNEHRASHSGDAPIPEVSSHLTLPATSGRLSRQSNWTDCSVDSEPLPAAAARRADNLNGGDSPTFGHVTILQPSFATYEPERLDDYSPDRHPPLEPGLSQDHYRDYGQLDDYHDTVVGEDFTLSQISPRSDVSGSYLPSPRYEPPPIPTPTSELMLESRPSSSIFFNNSQHSTHLTESHRQSEDIGSLRSTEATSVETVDHIASKGASTTENDVAPLTPEEAEEAAKEKKRLTQRRNVIKELVDTEAVFVRDMNIVEEIYKGTAEACPKLDDKTVKIVFRNTEEIIGLHTSILDEVKDAVASIYVPPRPSAVKDDAGAAETGQPAPIELSDANDRLTSIGPVFSRNMEKLKQVHEAFLKNSDQAAKRLIQIQQDPTVKVWLNECNEVAKELTAAWDLDSLLIKPMQRITKYPNLIITLMQHTPADHPDRESLIAAKDALETAIIEINQTKKNVELVGQIVGRKRKDSDVKAGFARAFGKRVDKIQNPIHRPPEDSAYAKLNEKFGDDYLRLQVVLRDVEFYTRQVTAYVHEFMQYMSSVELVMRLQPGSWPELESKWVQFNISVRDLQKVALEDHLSHVRKRVIEPFESVIKAYSNPSLAMKKRQKRRLDFERAEQLKRSGKSVDSKLKEQVEQYEALNGMLVKELPKLSALTEKVGNICLVNLVNAQTAWYKIWTDKMKAVLVDSPDMPELQDIVSVFQRDHPYAVEQLNNIGILNPAYKGRPSASTAASENDVSIKAKGRPPDIDTKHRPGLIPGIDVAPSLPTPDFARQDSGSLVGSPHFGEPPSPHHFYYKDYYSGIQTGSTSSFSPELSSGFRSHSATTGQTSTRPGTGRSYDSAGLPRQSSDSAVVSSLRRDSSTTHNSSLAPQEHRRFSGLFHSALPLPDGPEEALRSSRASSRERGRPSLESYNVLWLAASLFEFNISTTKHEAGYPYLVYQAGEIFDVIAEKGELWLAKNQDDPTEKVGWIWSKHFAKLADS